MNHERSDADRKLALERMASVCEAFYLAAVATDCHAFIEFTGLLGEFLNVCRDAEDSGNRTWMGANVHGGHLPMAPFRLGYLREKLACIYGPALLADAEGDLPEEDPIRDAERSLSALALATYHEPGALPVVLHSIGHMVQHHEDAIGAERVGAWLKAQNRRASDGYVRAAAMCEHADLSPDEKSKLFTEAMTKLEATGQNTIFAKFLRAMSKAKPQEPPAS